MFIFFIHINSSIWITQFSISTQFSSILPIDWTLSGATTPDQSRPGNDENKWGNAQSQNPSITGASPSDWLVSLQDTHWGSINPLYWCNQCIQLHQPNRPPMCRSNKFSPNLRNSKPALHDNKTLTLCPRNLAHRCLFNPIYRDLSNKKKNIYFQQTSLRLCPFRWHFKPAALGASPSRMEISK